MPKFDINEQGIKEMASDQTPNPALNSATNYPIQLLVSLDEKVRDRVESTYNYGSFYILPYCYMIL